MRSSLISVCVKVIEINEPHARLLAASMSKLAIQKYTVSVLIIQRLFDK
jgi:hypothetical protein